MAPTGDDAVWTLEQVRKLEREGGKLTPVELMHLMLKAAYRAGLKDVGAEWEVRRAEGRSCGCPFTGGKCALCSENHRVCAS